MYDMINSKRILTIFISLLVLMTVISCSGGNSNDTKNENDLKNEILRFMLMDARLSGPRMFIIPQEDSYYVSPTSNIYIIFSEDVNKTGNWSVTVDSVEYTNASPEATWDTICLAGYCYPELIIHPSRPMMREKRISVSAQGFTTEKGRSFSDSESNFYTSSVNLYFTVSPHDYSIRYPTDTNVEITFSEAVDTSADWSVTIDGIVYDNSSSEIIWDDLDTTVTINPVGVFGRNSTVFVTSADFTAKFDGSPFPRMTTSFNTIPNPTATIKPENGETAVNINSSITITFTEPIIPDDSWSVTADGTTYDASSNGISWTDNKTLVITPAKAFGVLSSVNVVLEDFHAACDNALISGLIHISFTTGLWVENIPMNDSIYSNSRFSSVSDSTGALYVGYPDSKTGNLNYLTNKSGSWQAYPVDIGNFSWCNVALAIDSTDTLLAAHADYWDRYLTFEKLTGGVWSKEIVDPDEDRGDGFSLTVDASDNAHVSYWNTYPTNDLITANNQAGSWSIEIVDAGFSNGGYNSSIAVDSQNKIHISYCANDNLRYATNKNGLWEVFTIDSNRYTGYSSVIAVDSNDVVHIAYFDRSDSFNWCIRYATNKDGTWRLYRIDKVRYAYYDISICVDSKDVVYISFIDFIQSEYKSFVKMATNKSGTWSVYSADSDERLGNNLSMHVDHNNTIHIFYECGLDDEVLRHAVYAP